MHESLLTRFSQDHPCWNRELLERAGEDAAGLDELTERGLLTERGGVYALTESGAESFRRAAAEMFLDECPGGQPEDAERCLLTTALWLELERTNVQRWGLKRYVVRPDWPVRPALRREEVWRLEDGKLRWLYPDEPRFKAMLELHPAVPHHRRRPEIPDPAAWAAWRALPGERLGLDLALIVNYDFENYLDFKGHAGDEHRLVNTDRFYFSAAATAEEQLDALGRFHRLLWELRRLAIPGYLDCDVHEQDSVNWLIFVSRTRAEAEASLARLITLGDELIRPVNPMEIWTLALEDLRAVPDRCEVIWDVLPQAARPVCLTL